MLCYISSSEFLKQERNMQLRSLIWPPSPWQPFNSQWGWVVRAWEENIRFEQMCPTEDSGHFFSQKKTCGLLGCTSLTTWLHSQQGSCFPIDLWNWQKQILPLISEQVYSPFLMRLFQLSLQKTCQAKSRQTVTVTVSDEEAVGGHAPKIFSPPVILGDRLATQQPCFGDQKLTS